MDLMFIQVFQVLNNQRLLHDHYGFQAGESIYKHFNIYKGKIAHFSPADRTKQYFMERGMCPKGQHEPITCPLIDLSFSYRREPMERQTTADLLVSVTDLNGRNLQPGHVRPLQTVTELADYFKNSGLGCLNRKDLQEHKAEFGGKADCAKPYKESARVEGAGIFRKGRYVHRPLLDFIFS